MFSGVGVLALSAVCAVFRGARRSGAAKSSREGAQKPSSEVPIHSAVASTLDYIVSKIIFIYAWCRDQTSHITTRIRNRREKKKRDIYYDLKDSTTFFSYRFADAFPGCRDVTIIEDPSEAVCRLDILLRMPLSVEIKKGTRLVGASPIWWFRGSQNLPIRTYNRIRKFGIFRTNDVLLNGVELHRIRRIAALGSTSYWATAVYVETDGVPPSGLYNYSTSEYEKKRGYGYEEVGVYKGRFIRREEYDDGSAIINGKVVRTLGKAKLQVRYLSSYNFLIVPIASPVNESRIDGIFNDMMRKLLDRSMSVHELAAAINGLPRNPREKFM